MYTKENGTKIRLMVKENMYIKTKQCMLVNGILILNKAKEPKHGLMELLILDNITKEKSKEMVNLFGLKDLNIMDNFSAIILKVMEIISGLMAESIKDNGS